MGAVMSYALALGKDRPAPAGILALSDFLPTVEGWRPSLADRQGLRAFIDHGTRDPVIAVEFARRARDLLAEGGLAVEYHEFGGAHQVDVAHFPAAAGWLGATLGRDTTSLPG
jgi:phospholipase/carboxylesterase